VVNIRWPGSGANTTSQRNVVGASCHENAVEGAARAGDMSAWQPRLEKGIEALYENTINGIGEMPPRGGCGNACTDGDLMSLVDLMVGGPG
jgi:cytochrome c5